MFGGCTSTASRVLFLSLRDECYKVELTIAVECEDYKMKTIY